MTVQTLSSVTLQTIENYRTAAIFAVDAYRLGSLRLIDAVNGGLVNSVYPRTSKLAPQLTKTVSQVRGDLSDIIVTGVGEVAARTDKAIKVSSDAMAGGVSKVAKYAATIDNPIVVNGLEAAVRISLPGAQVARTVSAKVAEGADALARVASGKKTSVKKAAATAKRATTTAKRKVVRKAAATKTAVRKAAAPSKAVVAAKKPRAKRQAAAAA
ncbi:MAG: hypothetical protein KDG44_01050 [Burkholderiaceae bacterium]|nr:hypothetical protein [Burkholderiaceae bacterium]